MVNYQLYRTNVLLGGQMKYDLILKNASTELVVDGFHITPISNKVPYNKYIKDNLLNYTHNDNISRYYKNISGSFYKDFIDTELADLYPLISETKKNYDDTYEMGCRRMNYELYNKQFSYLCPIWLEQIKGNECLMFEFNLYTAPEQTKSLSTKSLYIDIFNNTVDNTIYHNKFVNYFNDYLKYIKCEEGNDWVIDIKDDCSLINGINMETGSNKISNSRFIYQNLTNRERPLMEQNNIIINELSDNKLIVKQLFNFNFCFNLSDICKLSTTQQILNNQLLGKNLYAGVNVYICDKTTKNIISKLERRDLFSNHDYIKKICCNPNKMNLKYNDNEIEIDNSLFIEDRNKYIKPTDELNELNVLSYLQDYNCIDLIDKNKIIQNTIHWSTLDSPEITFNFYRGFSGYLNNNDNNIILNDTNAYTPDTDTEIYTPYLNQYWCNSIELKLDDDTLSNKNMYINFIKELINTPFKYEHIFSKFNKKCTVKNIRYECGDESIVTDQNDNQILYDKDINVLIIYNNIDNFITDETLIRDTNIIYTKFNNDSGFYTIIDKRDVNHIQRYLIFIYKKDKQYLPIKQIKKILNNLSEKIQIAYTFTDEYKFTLYRLNEIISSKTSTDHVYVTIPSSLDAVVVNGPSLSVSEFEYFKNNKSKFIERNIGKIKPTFIKADSENFFNFKFSKLNINDIKSIPKYLNYQKLGFFAKYPSIGYYPFKKDIQMYTPNNLINKYEYNSFYYNKLLNLSEDISTVFISKRDEYGNYKPLESYIYEYIKDIYDIQNEDLFQYVLSLYNYTFDFEYSSNEWDPKIGPEYIYDVKIKLK